MPQLVSLYIRNIVAGFGLALAFVALLLVGNVANLWHLISTSDIGYIALALLVVFNTIVFAGVQFGIAVMRMAEDGSDGQGGRRDGVPAGLMPDLVPIPVPVRAQARAPRR